MTTLTAKSWLRVDWGDDNTLIDAIVAAATRYVESITWRSLVTQTWDLKLYGFPVNDAPIYVPRPPLSSVTSITYRDTAGATQTLAAADYTVVTQSEPGRIVPSYGNSWPSTYDEENSVTVRFVAGYGALTALPSPIVQAIKLIMAHLYENRGDAEASMSTSGGAAPYRIPSAAYMLLTPYMMRDDRVMEFVA